MRYRVEGPFIEIFNLRNKHPNFRLIINCDRVDLTRPITKSFTDDKEQWVKIPVTRKDGSPSDVLLEVERALDVTLIEETVCILSSTRKV